MLLPLLQLTQADRMKYNEQLQGDHINITTACHGKHQSSRHSNLHMTHLVLCWHINFEHNNMYSTVYRYRRVHPDLQAPPCSERMQLLRNSNLHNPLHQNMCHRTLSHRLRHNTAQSLPLSHAWLSRLLLPELRCVAQAVAGNRLVAAPLHTSEQAACAETMDC